jgi:succinoglycan biosynthesis transport protein ExoP
LLYRAPFDIVWACVHGCGGPNILTDFEQTSLSTEQFLRILRRRAPWILACIVLAAAAGYGYSKQETKKYTATASVAFSNGDPLSQQIAGLAPSSSSSSSVLAQQNSDLELVSNGAVAEQTARSVGHGLTGGKITASLHISSKGESNIVAVSATSTSPAIAAAIANAYVGQFVKEQQAANRRFFRSALALVNKQLAALSPAQRIGEDGLDLVDRAHTLGLLAELGYENVQIGQEALVPTSPSAPRTTRNTGLCAVLGLLIGVGIAFLLERLDRRISAPEDLEVIYRLPMLGVIPESRALAHSARNTGNKKGPLPPREAEAFSLVLAHLRFFNVDRDVRSLIIASPAPGDGKTTIAHHLAEAAARSGSRVLLLETDLRQPTLAGRLDIQSGPGLAGVLIGAVSTDEATQSVRMQSSPGDGIQERTYDLMAGGAVLPPNPGELLESRAMGAVLERARSAYDLVVIDTPPLTAVSDAFPLLTKVDGVLIVGRVGRSRRDTAEQLHQVLSISGAPLLGVIANGSKSGGPSAYPGAASASPAVASANGAHPQSKEALPVSKT